MDIKYNFVFQDSFLLITSVILILSNLVGCGPSTKDLKAVKYAPLPGDDWKVSTPKEQGLDPRKEQITIRDLLQMRAGYPDADDYNLGCMGIFVSARDMAKLGLLYLNNGEFDGKQVLSDDWIKESLQEYSEDIKRGGSSSYGAFSDQGYGYQWWSSRVGEFIDSLPSD